MRGEKGTWNPGGRTVGWRLSTLVVGLLALGAGVSLHLWPSLLTWAISGALVLAGLFLAASALLARGPGRG